MRSLVTFFLPERRPAASMGYRRRPGNGRCPGSWRSLCPRRLHCLAMIIQNLRQLGARQSAETAIGAKAEARQEFARRRDPLLEAPHVMDGAEIDAGAIRFQIRQRAEERIIAAI